MSSTDSSGRARRAAVGASPGSAVAGSGCRDGRPDGGAGAQVGLDHAVVRLHLGRRALGDLLAAVEHGDAVGDAHHDLHVVLDHQHRQPLSSRSLDTKAVKSALSCGFMPAVGSSSSSSLRLGGERPRHLQPALVAVGQVHRVLLVDRLGQRAVAQDLAGPLHRLAALAAHPRRAQDAADDAALGAAVHAHQHVLERAHGLEQADVLEGAAHAQLGDRVGGQSRHLAAVEHDLAGGRRVGAGEHVEEGGLAGAVGPDQADDAAAGNGEVDVVARHQAAELLAHLLRLRLATPRPTVRDHGRGRPRPPPRRP